MSDFLDLDELYDVHKKQDHNRIAIYREIYRKCLTKMKHTNNILRRMECNFQVPSFVWGIPIYDYDDLKEYILFRLHENGLTQCHFVDPTTIYLSWKPEDIDKKKYQTAKKKFFTPTTTTTNNNEIPVLQSGSGLVLGSNTNPYKTNDNRPTSTMMKFDNIFEVPVNLDKIRQVKNAARIPSKLKDATNKTERLSSGPSLSLNSPSRVQPDRRLAESWKNYFNKRKNV